jgi:transposase
MVTLKTLIVNAPAVLRQKLDALRGNMALIRHVAALRPGPMTSTVASAKTALRAIARRWLSLDAEIKGHDADLAALTAAQAPTMLDAPGISTATAAEMLILSETTHSASDRKRPLPNCAASVPSRLRAASRPGLD